MESLFKNFSEKWLGTVNSTVQASIEAKNYLYKSMLRPLYSVDMTFSSISGKNSNVTADVVSMDSDLPLKSRGTIVSYSGEIPKVGMQKYQGERQLKEIQVLQALNKPESQLAARIFDDYNACYVGATDKVEYMFQQALSTGVIEIGQDVNTGRSIRVDFGIPAANKFTVGKLWSDTTSNPIEDLDKIKEAADAAGVSSGYVLMDQVTFNYFKKNSNVVNLYGTAGLPSLTLDKANEVLQANFNLQIQIVNTSFKIEKDGVVTNVKAWSAGQVSFFSSLDNVGDLVYSDLAEKIATVPTKVYSYPEAWLQLTMEREGKPLREFTESQGLVMPVLNNVDQIFLLDTLTATV